MGVHDWSKLEAGGYHAWHLQWIATMMNALNNGVLPNDHFALPEQRTPDAEPDGKAIKLDKPLDMGGGVAVAEPKPKTRIVQKADIDAYAAKANRMAIRNAYGEVVSVIEVVSPGNKHSQTNFDQFVNKACHFIQNHVSFFVVDFFRPSPRDPRGIHAAIWERLGETCETIPPELPFTVASYTVADGEMTAYVEPIAVGQALPRMPLFLGSDKYVYLDLQATYETTWTAFPMAIKRQLMA